MTDEYRFGVGEKSRVEVEAGDTELMCFLDSPSGTLVVNRREKDGPHRPKARRFGVGQLRECVDRLAQVFDRNSSVAVEKFSHTASAPRESGQHQIVGCGGNRMTDEPLHLPSIAPPRGVFCQHCQRFRSDLPERELLTEGNGRARVIGCHGEFKSAVPYGRKLQIDDRRRAESAKLPCASSSFE